jgi:phenylalanine ammonia-lyase
MALVSGRYTHETIKLVRMLMATHIYALCQAADLRAMQTEFRKELFEIIAAETLSRFSFVSESPEFKASLLLTLRNRAVVLLNETVDQDSGPRFHKVFTSLTATLSGKLAEVNGDVKLNEVEQWRVALTEAAGEKFVAMREAYEPGPDSLARQILGKTKTLYSFVRGELDVKMHSGDPLKDVTKIGTEISKVCSFGLMPLRCMVNDLPRRSSVLSRPLEWARCCLT